jgi:hypothetical protein
MPADNGIWLITKVICIMHWGEFDKNMIGLIIQFLISTNFRYINFGTKKTIR